MNENINCQINEILTYLKDIDNLNIKNKKQFIENREKKLASSMAIFNILNSTIEIGEIIISEKELEIPQKYREIFEILKQNKIISTKIANTIKNYIYHKNMLAHQYGKIKFEELYVIIENKKIFLDYIKEIKTQF